MNPPNVRILVFDVFGTVVDWRSSVIAQGRALGADKALDVDWEAFVDEWKAAYRPGMDKVNSGEWPLDEGRADLPPRARSAARKIRRYRAQRDGNQPFYGCVVPARSVAGFRRWPHATQTQIRALHAVER